MTWHQDLLSRLTRSRTREDMFAVVSSAVKKLEFTHCCYGAGLPTPGRRPEAVIYQNYPSGWIQHYSEHRYIEIDPTVLSGQKSTHLQLWNDELFASAPQLWDDAQDFGLRVGVAQSAWAIGGCYGLLSLSRDGQPLTQLELEDKTFKVAWLAQTLHSAMVDKGRVVPEAKPSLTPREYEVLGRLSEGWTAESIGNALSISTRTANYHIGNILRKLNADNKVQAIVTAISTGLLAI